VKIRLYFDEDAMDEDVVDALRIRGVDVLTPLEAKTLGRDDINQLDFATERRRVLYTFNQGHFHQLHIQYVTGGRPHAGIILGQQQRFSVGEQMRRLLKIIAAKSAEDIENQIVFLSSWG
jgi:hypothetical protein